MTDTPDLSLEPQSALKAPPRSRARKPRSSSTGRTRRTPRAAHPLGDAAPAGRPSRSSKASGDALTAIAGMLTMANGAIAMVAPDDVLSEQEILQLADALLKDPWTGAPLTKVKAFAHAPLIMAAVAIAVPRLVRHGLVPLAAFGADGPAPGGEFVAPEQSGDSGDPFNFERPRVPDFAVGE